MVTPLLQAIISNKLEAVKYLIFKKADIYQEGEANTKLLIVNFKKIKMLKTVKL